MTNMHHNDYKIIFENARNAFEKYLDTYDRTDDKTNLKIVHTYGVVNYATELAGRMNLSEEDTALAQIIALLHDIGRFEQLKRFHSFEPGVMDHAAYGAQILFEEGMIREFVPEPRWDAIIHFAIDKHSDYQLPYIEDNQTRLHAMLIRDADKLDNCRVKLEESIETLLDTTPEEVGRTTITPSIQADFFANQSILASKRITKMDYWISYFAYYYDINYRESLDIIEENDFVTRIIKRIPYSNKETADIMKKMESHMIEYVHTAKI